MGLSQNIGRRIKACRLRIGMTQEQFAKSIGVSDGAISSYELGDTLPSIKNAIQIARLSGVTLDWLFTGSEMDTQDEPPEEEKGLTEEEIRMLIAFRRAGKSRKRIVLELLIGDTQPQAKKEPQKGRLMKR